MRPDRKEKEQKQQDKKKEQKQKKDQWMRQYKKKEQKQKEQQEKQTLRKRKLQRGDHTSSDEGGFSWPSCETSDGAADSTPSEAPARAEPAKKKRKKTEAKQQEKMEHTKRSMKGTKGKKDEHHKQHKPVKKHDREPRLPRSATGPIVDNFMKLQEAKHAQVVESRNKVRTSSCAAHGGYDESDEEDSDYKADDDEVHVKASTASV